MLNDVTDARSRRVCRPTFRCRRTTAPRAISQGCKLPSLPLAATDGSQVDLSKLAGRTVRLHLSAHRRARAAAARRLGRNSRARAAARRNPARFRDHFAELKRLGVAQLFGLSTQDTAYQREAVERLHLPFPILSDATLELDARAQAADLQVAGMTLLKRMALVIDDGVITKVFYPVFPPDKNAEEVIAWLSGVEIGAHRREHLAEHLRRQHAGVGVVARAVIAANSAQLADLVRAPWPNGAAAAALRRAPRTVLSWAMRPSVTMARSFGISAMVAVEEMRGRS